MHCNLEAARRRASRSGSAMHQPTNSTLFYTIVFYAAAEPLINFIDDDDDDDDIDSKSSPIPPLFYRRGKKAQNLVFKVEMTSKQQQIGNLQQTCRGSLTVLRLHQI